MVNEADKKIFWRSSATGGMATGLDPVAGQARVITSAQGALAPLAHRPPPFHLATTVNLRRAGPPPPPVLG